MTYEARWADNEALVARSVNAEHVFNEASARLHHAPLVGITIKYIEDGRDLVPLPGIGLICAPCRGGTHGQCGQNICDCAIGECGT